MITSTQLRDIYVAFFTEREHVAIPSASLVPIDDPSVLFTTAGMHPLVPYLLGAPHPEGKRLVNVQRCVRTGDIDAIGDDTHLTFFEMLGNWSLGDYGKPDAIRWSFEFLTGVLGLPLDRLGATCFAGDADAPRDDESARIWRELGMPRVQFLGRDDNWWGPAGETGPCGPDTEMFYWVGPEPAPRELDVSDRRWVEIWNNVFMSYTRTERGTIEPLARGNVDTGMGLERTLVAINGLGSVYEVDTVAPILGELRALAPGGPVHELRVITDHLRAACAIIGDGVAPTNKDRGYVLRRLIRRCLVFARRLALPDGWTARVVDARARPVIDDEIARFDRTLAQGLRQLGKHAVLDGAVAFDLYQTHGFPFELTFEIAQASGKHVDRDSFARALAEHRARSRTTTGFAGGLADHSAEIVRFHTLTHLLQAALREVLGPHVIQRGSNITRDRLRFDYTHDGKPSPEELARVEALVNGWLGRELEVERASMTEPEARALGALGAFGEKYGATVSVYTIRDRATGEVISCEFCGGPHVRAPADISGRFQIVREQGVSAGIRRIRGMLVI